MTFLHPGDTLVLNTLDCNAHQYTPCCRRLNESTEECRGVDIYPRGGDLRRGNKGTYASSISDRTTGCPSHQRRWGTVYFPCT